MATKIYHLPTFFLLGLTLLNGCTDDSHIDSDHDQFEAPGRSEDNEEVESPSDDDSDDPAPQQTDADDATTIDETTETYCDLGPIDPHLSIEFPGSVTDFATIEQTVLGLNIHDADGKPAKVNLYSQVLSEQGTHQTELLDYHRLSADEPDREVTLDVPLTSLLPLSTTTPVATRMLVNFTAEVEQLDGSAFTSGEGLTLLVEQIDGRVRVTDTSQVALPTQHANIELEDEAPFTVLAAADEGIATETVDEEEVEPPGDQLLVTDGMAADAEAVLVEHTLHSNAAPQQAGVTQGTLCLNVNTEYTDAGFGEDIYAYKWGGRRARYALIQINGSFPRSVYLDSKGCTSWIFQTGVSTQVKLYSRGRRADGKFTVERQSDKAYSVITLNVKFTEPVQSKTYTIGVGGDTVTWWSAYSTIAQGYYRANGGENNLDLTVRVFSAEGNKATTNLGLANDRIYLKNWGARKKFVVGHELGHIIGARTTDDGFGATGSLTRGDCSYSADNAGVINAPCWPSSPDNSSDHGLKSLEYAGCAISEGWAHFYASMLWNDKTSDGTFVYWPGGGVTTHSLESGDFDNRVSQCVSKSATRRYGVEEDWMRLFWDVWTQKVNGSNPTHLQMLDWIDDSSYYTSCPDYGDLNNEANQKGGAVNANWDKVAVWNGANYAQKCG